MRRIVVIIVLFLLLLISICTFFLTKNKISSENSLLESSLYKKNIFLMEDIKLIKLNELYMIESELNYLNPNFIINTLDYKSKPIKEVIGSGNLFFYFSEHYCGSCYESIINKINSFIDSVKTTKIIVIVEFENLRNLQFFLKENRVKAPIYYVTKSINIPAIKAEQPFFFVLDNSFQVKFVYIPDKKYNDNIVKYLSIVDCYLNKCKK